MGLNAVLDADLMGAIEWMFVLHDNDKDGSLTKDEVLKVRLSLSISLELSLNAAASSTAFGNSSLHLP